MRVIFFQKVPLGIVLRVIYGKIIFQGQNLWPTTRGAKNLGQNIKNFAKVGENVNFENFSANVLRYLVKGQSCQKQPPGPKTVALRPPLG